jgi:alanyl-tRNA synthetase
MTSSHDIRKKFITYFKDKGHHVERSGSLIPSDKTVLLTIAGMLPFKAYFLGEKKAPYDRATSVQKCIRTNDIEQVGLTPRHHTFFEMLGNFSFGDYFKKEAISYAYDFLVNELNIPLEKLFISVFTDDDEAWSLWLSETPAKEEQLIRLDGSHNFWEAGPTGPCGPCSEIYYDTGVDPSCDNSACAPGCECNRYLEIWNLVFMEFNKDSEGILTPLPKKNIDTGMGLERIASVVQGVSSNFETDLFKPLITRICDLAPDANKVATHIIADHIKAITFMLADGIFPGNDGRGYILKKILRRATRYGKLIGIQKPFLHMLSEQVILEFGDSYPELNENKKIILESIKTEESNFLKTLDIGLKMIDEIIKLGHGISGDEAFKLYDTYGFPLELTLEIAEENKITVDTKTFDLLMSEQKERARSNSVFYDEEGNKASGGEAIIASSEEESLEMARNHSGTHLLHAALHKVLGKHATQSGSMVSPDRLRFDFTHPKALSTEEIIEVEKIVNNSIMSNLTVDIEMKGFQKAIDDGAMALFTEKYDQDVRVVKMGEVSMELCGGTHINRTGDIGPFKIISETAISSGVRRIEALTGRGAVDYIEKTLAQSNSVANLLKVKPDGIAIKVKELATQNQVLSKELATLQSKLLTQHILQGESEKLKDISVFYYEHELKSDTPLNVKAIIEEVWQKKGGITCLVLPNHITQRITVAIKMDTSLSKETGVHAGTIIKELSAMLGGNGGGKPTFAQGGGKDFDALPKLKEVFINSILATI